MGAIDRDKITLAENDFEPRGAPAMAVNIPYELTGRYDLEYVKHQSISKVSADTAKLLRHGYYASVSYIDACLGKLMNALEELDLSNNTTVVVLGEHNGWTKMTNYNIDTRVPLIVRAPGIPKMGKTEGLVELIDVYPTLCDLAGIDMPPYLQGTSFKPLLEHPEREWKSAAFSQFQRRPRESLDGKNYMGYSMVTDKYHFVEWYGWDGNLKKRLELQARELYDLEQDPEENINIVNRENNVTLVKKLSNKLNNGWEAAKPIPK